MEEVEAEEDDEEDQDDGADLDHLDQVPSEIVHDGGVHLVAEGEPVLLGNGEGGT